MKCNLLVTQRCNLRCHYCYIGKKPVDMPLPTAKKAVDFIFARSSEAEKIHIGFFGGEPLMAFDLIRDVTAYIEDHSAFDQNRVELAIITNGTLFSEAVARFVNNHQIRFCISCDGPPQVHDRFRQTIDGQASSALVSRSIELAVKCIDQVMVNAVYHPDTFLMLPETVDYLSGMGVRHIHLNPDYSALWSPSHIAGLDKTYGEIADRYVRFHLNGTPHFINLIDSKIILILRNGYSAEERCRMGKAEMAFSPDGGIYPCERLVGAANEQHRIGHLDSGIQLEKMTCHMTASSPANSVCRTCGLRDYCMNWCGCSNFFATGYYNLVNTFICASEKAAIRAAFMAFQALGETVCDRFYDHMNGHPQINARTGT